MPLLEGTQTLPLAYIGPGAGLSLIGALIMLLFAIGGALFFVLLWPLRALFRKFRGSEVAAESLPTNPEGGPRASESEPEPAQATGQE